MSFADFEKDLFEFLFEMFGFLADSFFLQEVSSGLILGFHLTIIHTILKFLRLILEILLILLQLIIKDHVLLELDFVVTKQWMLDDIGEGHPLFAIHHKDTLEEVLQLARLLFQLFFLAHGPT